MILWRALFSPNLYRLFFYVFLAITLYLMIDVPVKVEPRWWLNDKVAHAITFFGLTLCFSRGLPVLYGPTALLGLAAFGMLIELIQYFIPWRSFSIADWFADLAGILLYHGLHLIRTRTVKIIRPAEQESDDV